jgi:hypothetical protein
MTNTYSGNRRLSITLSKNNSNFQKINKKLINYLKKLVNRATSQKNLLHKKTNRVQLHTNPTKKSCNNWFSGQNQSSPPVQSSLAIMRPANEKLILLELK